jgi:hypothetical protein
LFVIFLNFILGARMEMRCITEYPYQYIHRSLLLYFTYIVLKLIQKLNSRRLFLFIRRMKMIVRKTGKTAEGGNNSLGNQEGMLRT